MVRIYIPGKLTFDTGINSQFCARFGVAKGGENNIPGELSSFLNKISDMAGVGDKDDLGKQKLCYSFRNEKKDKNIYLNAGFRIRIRIRIRRIRMFLPCPDPDPDPGKKVRK